MENKMIDGVKVAVNYAQASDTPVSDDEIKAYIKRAYDKWAAHRDAGAGLSGKEKAAEDAAFQEQGLVVASGLLGGESVVGVILAFVSVGLSLLG